MSVASWREAVMGAAGHGKCDWNTERTIGVLIDSEMLQKSGDDMALMALAADLQQHRRLPGLPEKVSALLDQKARGIGKMAQTVMQSRLQRTLLGF
mmetsp:Transcript_77008/g.204393  ORF Transcript_77008/g.204393 Transcript_77008/m.204393 type:complete len:96 (+) Transcript_77008:129-416(+)